MIKLDFLKFSLLTFFALQTNFCEASEIKLGSKNELCDVRLNGEIVRGDHDKFVNIFRSIENNGHKYPFGFILCLNSPGGSFDEAVKIVDFMLQKTEATGIPTRLENNSSCLSACALIFMAGNGKEAEFMWPDRIMDAGSQLGFHAPSPGTLDGEREYSNEYVAARIQSANRAISKMLLSDREGFFPQSLLALALGVSGSDSFINIDTVGKVGGWKIGLSGYAFPERQKDNLFQHICMNVEGWITRHSNEGDTKWISRSDPSSVYESDTTYYNKPTVIVDSNKNVRAVMNGVGLEAVQFCVVELYKDQEANEFVLRADIVDNENDAASTKYGLWAAYEMNTQLSKISQ